MEVARKYLEYQYVFNTKEDLLEQIRIDVSYIHRLGNNTTIKQVFPEEETIYNISNNKRTIQLELYPLDENIVVEVFG
jgi:hypothetical protein